MHSRQAIKVYQIVFVFLSTFVLTNSTEDEEKEIVEENGWGTLVTVTALRGTTALLPCNIHASDSNDPVLLVLWYKNASVTPVYSYDSRGEMGNTRELQQWADEDAFGRRAWFDTSTSPAYLKIRQTSGRDEGSYRCKVHFKHSPSWSQRIQFIVEDPPGFPRMEGVSGHRLEGPIGPYEDGFVIKIKCSCKGDPPPDLRWGGVGSHHALPVEVREKTAIMWTSVTASRATLGDEVECIASSHLSERKTNVTSISIKVNLPPIKVYLESPGDWVTGGVETSFRCVVIGVFPEAVIQWWIDGRQIKHGINTETSRDGNTTFSTLTLTPGPGDDGTRLICKAFSVNIPSRVMEDQLSLAVHYVPLAQIGVDGTKSVDSNSGSLVNVDARQGSSVSLSCTVKANPPVYNVTWYHNGKPVVRQEDKSIQIVKRTLKLENVTANRHGLYMCLASNEEGDGQSNAMKINIHYAPRCVKSQPNEYVVEKGSPVVISCAIEAFPSKITFSWALQIDRGPATRLPNVGRPEGLVGRYTMTNVQEDHLKVLCWAKNDIGRQQNPCVFHIITQGRPAIVSGCVVSNHTTLSFIVHCPERQKFQGSLDTVYNMQVYKQRGTSSSAFNNDSERGPEEEVVSFGALDDLVQNLTNSKPFFTVRDLSPGREFALVIRAFNVEGISPPSVLSAYTLRDTAQTLKASSGTGFKDQSSDSVSSSDHEDSVSYEEIDDHSEDTILRRSLIPPMMIILVASLSGICVFMSAVIWGLRKRTLRKRAEKDMQQQIKMNEELPYMEKESVNLDDKSESLFDPSIQHSFPELHIRKSSSKQGIQIDKSCSSTEEFLSIGGGVGGSEQDSYLVSPIKMKVSSFQSPSASPSPSISLPHLIGQNTLTRKGGCILPFKADGAKEQNLQLSGEQNPIKGELVPLSEAQQQLPLLETQRLPGAQMQHPHQLHHFPNYQALTHQPMINRSFFPVDCRQIQNYAEMGSFRSDCSTKSEIKQPSEASKPTVTFHPVVHIASQSSSSKPGIIPVEEGKLGSDATGEGISSL